MPLVIADGISTRFEVIGSGPPLLMFAPGGFDSTADKWRTLGIYAELKLLDHLPRRHTCIVYDRRECGLSGGRVETIRWRDYANQARALLAHLNIDRVRLMGGCMG
jgi:pimeloyl-ACP methyl ester carboxylesterase